MTGAGCRREVVAPAVVGDGKREADHLWVVRSIAAAQGRDFGGPAAAPVGVHKPCVRGVGLRRGPCSTITSGSSKTAQS